MSLSTTQYGYIVDPMVPFTDDKGKTIKNGFIRVFMAGTSTPVLTYRNYDGATNQEKIELDNSGRVKHNVIGSKGSLYKVVVYDAHHSQETPILTVDKIAVLGSSINASGATIVTGLDSVTVPEENFLKATVEGTGVELALDPTEVTSEVSTTADAVTAGPDYVAPLLDKTGTGDGKKISLANLFKFALDWISRLATTVTSFSSGDFIAVSNTTIGARKMSKDTLFELTAQNALGSIKNLPTKYKGFMALDDADGTGKMDVGSIFNNFAPAFDPTRTGEGDDYYKAGEYVMYNGTLYRFKVDHYGAWVAADAFAISVNELLMELTRDIETEIGSKLVASNYSGDKQIDEQLVLGNVDSRGDFDDTNHDRRHTNYIDLGSIKSLVGNQAGYESKEAWLRCFDASKNFVGSSYSGVHVDVASKTREDILANSPAGTKYIILVYSITESAAFGYVTVDYRYGAVGNLEERIDESLNRVSVLVGDKNDMTLSVTKYSMVQGSVDSSTGELTESTSRQRTDYIDITYVKEFYRPTTTTTTCWVRCYDSDKNYLGTPSFGSYIEYPKTVLVDDVLAELPNTKFVIIVISSGTSSVWVNSYDYVKVDSELVGRPVGFRQSNRSVIRFKFDIDDSHYSTGRLMLPSNYSASGKPTPLIVFCQGSGDYNSLDADMTTRYQTQYQYLCDEGFAILSIYGWGNVYNTSGVSTWNSKTNRKCWYGGIKWALEHYNLDSHNLFVSAKSMGGAQALALWYDGIFPVRAAGLLAPALNVEGHRWGYVNQTRHMYAQDMGFSEDINHVLDDEGTAEQFIAYATENYQKWIGYEPWLKGILGLTKQEQIDRLSPGRPGPFYTDTTLQRVGPVGSKIKIWSATDDTNLNEWANALILELQLTGCTAEMRNLPAGCTDPHHAVDTDPLAEQQTDVTTRLGVHYDSIALAYYEMAQMFIGELV